MKGAKQRREVFVIEPSRRVTSTPESPTRRGSFNLAHQHAHAIGLGTRPDPSL